MKKRYHYAIAEESILERRTDDPATWDVSVDSHHWDARNDGSIHITAEPTGQNLAESLALRHFPLQIFDICVRMNQEQNL